MSGDICDLPECVCCEMHAAMVGLLRSAGFCSGQPGLQCVIPVSSFSVCDVRRVLKSRARLLQYQRGRKTAAFSLTVLIFKSLQALLSWLLQH